MDRRPFSLHASIVVRSRRSTRLALLFAIALASGCSGDKASEPQTPADSSAVVTGGGEGAPGANAANSSAVDPEKAIIGTWILDNEAMEKRVQADAKYANLDPMMKKQLLGIVGAMQGTCELDGSKISIEMSVPGQPADPPQVGKYRILNIDGKKLQIIMTDETGNDDRADAVLDGDRLFITFDGETMEFTRKK